MRILSPCEGLAPNPNTMTSTSRSGRLHSGHAYLEFDQVATRIFERLRLRKVEGFGNSDRLLHERIVQRANEVLLVPFVDWFESGGADTSADNPREAGVIVGRHCSMNVSSGQLTLSLRQKWACWREFLVAWLKILIYSVRPRDAGSMDLTGKRSCLLYGVGKENLIVDGSDARFAAYLASSPVTPLRNAQAIVVETPGPLISSEPGRVLYARDPLLFAWRQARVKAGPFLHFLARHIALPFRLANQSSRAPELLTIARDTAYLALIECMQKHLMLSDVVYTSSNFLSQPIWLRGDRNFSLHMVHYSQAWQVFAYAQDGLRSEYPQMRWVRCDEHWVWTEGFAKYIAERDASARIHVVGPIVWHKPGAIEKQKAGIMLAVFDVPALSDAAARSCGELSNFWRASNLKAFIDDLIRLRDELQKDLNKPVKLVLKVKRINPDYDQDYADYVNRKSSEGKLELAPINENLFKLISGSDIAIVFPYSTPAYVASNLGVAAVYHDPTRSLLPTFEAADGIAFSSGYDELLAQCRRVLAIGQ